MSEYSFTKRLAILIGIDTVIAIVDSYVPANWTPVRTAMAALQLGFMVYTMGVALKRVLQDY
jgi:hypothetical protein